MAKQTSLQVTTPELTFSLACQRSPDNTDCVWKFNLVTLVLEFLSNNDKHVIDKGSNINCVGATWLGNIIGHLHILINRPVISADFLSSNAISSHKTFKGFELQTILPKRLLITE